MLNGCWRRAAVLLAIAAALGGFAGCTGSVSHSASRSPSASQPGKTAPFGTAKLRGALLTRINGVTASAPAAVGAYASLPETSVGSRPRGAVTVTPKACARVTLTGFNSGALAASPAAAVTFRVGRNNVFEVIVASSGSAAATALADQFAKGCASYRETIGGRTFRYTVRESAVTGIGEQARALNVKTTGAAVTNQWSMIYRGAGFVGSVTVAGPNASRLAVRQLAEQAYAYAAKSLS